MKADIIVIGGGHAGCEAAAAAARIGVKTILITHKFETIGQMSCNPAIGGVGKSHLVKEIDAADGIMARCADRAAIHLKVLNSSKGPAVRATRAQADRELYKKAVQKELKNLEHLEILEASAIGDAKFLYKWNEDHSFLKRNVDIHDVGNSALYLLSDLANGVTGEIHYVDAGYNKVGMPDPKNIT